MSKWLSIRKATQMENDIEPCLNYNNSVRFTRNKALWLQEENKL
mgnify:CR=1 FL=1